MKTLTTFKNSIPLWKSANNLWQIEKISESELIATNGNNIAYCYVSNDYNTLYWDRIIAPKYVNKKALQIAKKHIKTIYK